MKEILEHLINHHTLSQDEAYDMLAQISNSSFNACEVSAFLMTFNLRSITLDELIGFRNCLRDRCLPIDLSEFNPIDLCGTGGDGKDTFNISTLASFVVAGSGIHVAKHGNYGVSSTCGSSNVMEYLGYQFTNDSDTLKAQIEKTGLTFLHAPLFHPAMKAVAAIRRQLGLRTFFNMLGPMVNPSKPKRQIVGVFSLELLRYYKYIYEQDDVQFKIIHGLDGYDEISLTSDVKVCENNGDKILSPRDFNSAQIDKSALFGGTNIKEAADIFIKVLEGKGSVAQVNTVCANAALAIQCAQPKKNISEAFLMAKESLNSGKAHNVLNKLIDQ